MKIIKINVIKLKTNLLDLVCKTNCAAFNAPKERKQRIGWTKVHDKLTRKIMALGLDGELYMLHDNAAGQWNVLNYSSLSCLIPFHFL